MKRTLYTTICKDDDQHWVLASRSKLFRHLIEAQQYARTLDAGRQPEVWTLKQLRAAYYIGGSCRCGDCMCCDLRRDIRLHDFNMRADRA